MLRFKRPVVGQAVSFLATAFMYYQIAVIAISIIYECEPKEIELAVKKEMKLCHHLGRFCTQKFLGICYNRADAFCCYKSPLGRIIHEQLRLTSGIPWPEPSANPVCPGLTVSEFRSIDWSRIDLSEWLALLQSADLMPGSTAAADTRFTQDSMTRLRFPDGTQGPSAKDNATEALGAAQPSDARAYVRSQLWAPLP